MPMTGFEGFLPETVTFFDTLAENNTRQWFQDHKKEYENDVKHPAEEFVIAMGKKLEKIAPGINAIPKVNKSLFRINRDLRFSNDKSPYKTNLGILFWEGSGKRMDSSGFYFHMADGMLMLGVGMYCFPKPLFGPYRDAVAGKEGSFLQKAVKKVTRNGYVIGETKYKRVPRGYDPDHDNAELLKFGGLTARWTGDIPDEFFTNKIVDFSFAHFKKMAPIHYWLRDRLG
jgi:uncharacterized protein (TIGR02453 family)